MFPLCVRTQIYAGACAEILFNSLNSAVVNKLSTYSNYSTAKTLISTVDTPVCCLIFPWPLTHFFQRMFGILTEVQDLLAEEAKWGPPGSISSCFPVL